LLGSLHVGGSGCPVTLCLPFMLVLVSEPGRCGSFVLQGSTLVGLGSPAEGADAGGDRL
jgi:hypothetical protein